MPFLDRLRPHWRGILAAGVSALIGWLTFIANQTVPILDWFDLAIHETGHLLTAFMPEVVMFFAGSVAQVAFPLAMAWYFGFKRNEHAAAGFCLAWAGTSAWDVSVYAADATTQALPLIGGGTHDWAWILGRFNALDRTEQVAGFIEATGALLLLMGIVVALWPRQSDEAPDVSRIAVAAPLPVRSPRAIAGDPWGSDLPKDAA